MFSIFIRYNTLGGVCVSVLNISSLQYLRQSVCICFFIFTRYSTLGGVCVSVFYITLLQYIGRSVCICFLYLLATVP